MMRPQARTLLIALIFTIMLTAASGVAAGAAGSPAQFGVSAASAAERQMFGPELIGKVTKAGKVGNIDVRAGDVVLREAQVPGGRGGRTALGPATTQAATVLHGEHIRTIDPQGTYLNYRIVVAVQENQSKEVRGYAKGHLYADTIVGTDHSNDWFTVVNSDYDSAGDGCGPYPTGSACTYTKGPNFGYPSQPDFYILGQYRHKCGAAGWNCNNTWATHTVVWEWVDPVLDAWLRVNETCSYNWNVLGGQGSLRCQDA